MPTDGQCDAKSQNKCQAIEEALENLKGVVGEVETFAGRVSGDAQRSGEGKPERPSRAVGYLLSEMANDLDVLATRLRSAQESLQDSLY